MIIKFGTYKPQYYKGILEKAFLNIHTDIFNNILPFLSKESMILDFGCGEGAFSQRLKDNGFHVHSSDIDKEQFKATVDKFIHLDLNKEQIADNFDIKYDVIIAMEIIEHLENPWKFIRDIKSILNPGGLLVLSTPNISNFSSRIRFLQKGTFQGFEANDLSYGHITTITPFHLENIFKSEKFEIKKKMELGKIPFFHFDNISLFVILKTIFIPISYFFMQGNKDSWCIGYILINK